MVSSFRGRRQKSSEMGAGSWGLGARMQRKKDHLREIEEVRRQKGRRQKAAREHRPVTKDLIAGTEHRAILQLQFSTEYEDEERVT